MTNPLETKGNNGYATSVTEASPNSIKLEKVSPNQSAIFQLSDYRIIPKATEPYEAIHLNSKNAVYWIELAPFIYSDFGLTLPWFVATKENSFMVIMAHWALEALGAEGFVQLVEKVSVKMEALPASAFPEALALEIEDVLISEFGLPIALPEVTESHI